MTDNYEALIKEARERTHDIPPGPWAVEVSDDRQYTSILYPLNDKAEYPPRVLDGNFGAVFEWTHDVGEWPEDPDDVAELATFIAASRDLVPRLADALEELQRQIDTSTVGQLHAAQAEAGSAWRAADSWHAECDALRSKLAEVKAAGEPLYESFCTDAGGRYTEEARRWERITEDIADE